jgi:hypothetical protein
MQLIAADFSDILEEKTKALEVILGGIHSWYYAGEQGGESDKLAIELLACFTEEQVKASDEAMVAYKAHEVAITELRAARAGEPLVEYHKNKTTFHSRMQLRAQGN